eukprot:3031958-Prorocentrum_lima.AAC.1
MRTPCYGHVKQRARGLLSKVCLEETSSRQLLRDVGVGEREEIGSVSESEGEREDREREREAGKLA